MMEVARKGIFHPEYFYFSEIMIIFLAVMIANATDVPRFAEELAPTVWVLDMKRLNISAATNLVTQITRLGNPSR